MKSNVSMEIEKKSSSGSSKKEGGGEKSTDMGLSDLAQFFYLGKKPENSGYTPLNIPEINFNSNILGNYPIYINANGNTYSSKPIYNLLEEAIHQVKNEPEPGSPLEALAHSLNLWVEKYQLASQKSYCLNSSPDVNRELAEQYLNEFETSPESKKNLLDEISEILKHLPDEGNVVPFSSNIHFQTSLQIFQSKKIKEKTLIHNELKELAAKLKDLIDIHRSHFGSAVKKKGANKAMEQLQGVNIEKLAKSLPKYKGAKLINPKRLEAMENALVQLNSGIKNLETQPTLMVYSSKKCADVLLDPQYVKLEKTPKPLSAAVGYLKQISNSFTDLIKAIKLAQIEVNEAYVEEIHPVYLESIQWDFNGQLETRLLPEIIVYQNLKDEEYYPNLNAEYPIKFIMDYTLPDLLIKGSNGFQINNVNFALKQVFGLNCFVSHVNSCDSLSLIESLDSFSEAKGMGMSICCVSPEKVDSKTAFYKMDLAYKSRLTPYLKYSPNEEKGFSQSFSINCNPDLNSDWAILNAEKRVTPADYLLLETEWEHDFLQISSLESLDGELELHNYLNNQDNQSANSFPVINMENFNGERLRFGVSRGILAFSNVLLGQWKRLQELGGVHNYYAEKTKQEITEQIEQKFQLEMEQLKSKHAEELEEVRSKEAGIALEKLAEGLLNLNINQMSGSSTPSVAAQEEPKAVENLEPSESPQVKEEGIPEVAKPKTPQSLEPYIDSELCTSCNDCINVNNRLFKYNSDKQAEIADASQGTFAELVKAATKCPAKCIHPGSPREGDNTVTEQLMAQAETLN